MTQDGVSVEAGSAGWFTLDSPPRNKLTRRGEQTRDKLVLSAKELLEEVGYHGSTVTDITERSGVSLGSFYRYFDNKEELYLQLLQSLVQELYAAAGGGVWNAKDIQGSLFESTHRYLQSYYANRRLIAALQEMAGVVPESAALWWELRLRTFRRMQHYLEGSSGVQDPSLVVSALGGMVEQFANYWYVQGERHGSEVPPLEEAATTLSRLWFAAVYAGATRPRKRARS